LKKVSEKTKKSTYGEYLARIICEAEGRTGCK